MMSWIKEIFQKLKPKHRESNENSGKSFDQTYNELGVFTYDEQGFTINREGVPKRHQWSSVTQINVYKSDLLTIDRIEMEIVFGDVYLRINEDLPGWYQFVLKTKEVFPSIPKGWDIDIMQPPFERNYTTIYNGAS